VYYNSTKIIDEFASSTGIRSLLLQNQIDEIRKVKIKNIYNKLEVLGELVE